MFALGATAPSARADTSSSAGSDSRSVTFSTARDDAPVLSPGRYTTAAPSGSTETYAAIKRQQGASVTVGIQGAVDAEITTADGESTCSSQDRTTLSGGESFSLLSLDGSETKRQSYISEACRNATDLRLVLKASSSSTASATGGSQLKFAMTLEPRIAQLGQPSPAAGFSEISAPARTTSGEDRRLSSNLATPDTLTSTSYPVQLTVGSLAVARVRVDWGQRLAVSVEAPRNGSRTAPDNTLQVSAVILSPQWAAVSQVDTAILSGNSSTPQSASVYTGTVNAANRDLNYSSDTGDVPASAAQWTTTAGWYYVVIQTLPSASSSSSASAASTPSVPARLSVAVSGTRTSGPVYLDAAGSSQAAVAASDLSIGGSDGGGGSSPLPKIGLSVLLVLAGAGAFFAVRRLR